LLAGAAAAVVLAGRMGLIEKARASIGANQKTFDVAAVIGVLAAATWLHEEHFAILMMTTAMLLMVAALGLTVQFGFAGVVNFAGVAFLASAATRRRSSPNIRPALGTDAAARRADGGADRLDPHPAGLRTRGHYAALVTIAFGSCSRPSSR